VVVRQSLNVRASTINKGNKMKTFTIIVYNDPGHAWGKVKRKVIRSLGLESSISRYSYQLRDNVYLEEDVDLPLVANALMAGNENVRVVFVEKTTDKTSRIRGYSSYTPQGYANEGTQLGSETRYKIQPQQTA